MHSIFGDIIDYRGQLLPEDRVQSLPYYNYLVDAIKELKKDYPKFPKDRCNDALMRVCGFDTTRLNAVAGYYSPELIEGGLRRLRVTHSWCLDFEGNLYVDITQNQFSNELPEIVVMPANTRILRMDVHRTSNLMTLKHAHLAR